MSERITIYVTKGAGMPGTPKRDWNRDTGDYAAFTLEAPKDTQVDVEPIEKRELVQVRFLSEDGNPRGGKFTYALPEDLEFVALGDILLVPASGNICAVEVAEFGSEYSGPLKEALYNLEGEL